MEGHKVALELLHGRHAPETRTESWGSDGPIFLVTHLHCTYGCDLVLGLPAPEFEATLCCYKGLVFYDGVFYGDWSIVSIDSLDESQRARITAYEQSKASFDATTRNG